VQYNIRNPGLPGRVLPLHIAVVGNEVDGTAGGAQHNTSTILHATRNINIQQRALYTAGLGDVMVSTAAHGTLAWSPVSPALHGAGSLYLVLHGGAGAGAGTATTPTRTCSTPWLTHTSYSALEGNCGGGGEPGNVVVVVVSESRRARGRRPSAGSGAAVGNAQTGLQPEPANHVEQEQRGSASQSLIKPDQRADLHAPCSAETPRAISEWFRPHSFSWNQFRLEWINTTRKS
jgi:hypothetical protein